MLNLVVPLASGSLDDWEIVLDMRKALVILLLLPFLLSSILGCSRTGVAIGPNAAQVRAGIPLN